MVNDAGELLASASGPLPHPLQDIDGAELYAVLMILRHAGPGNLEVGVDCEALVSVWSRGLLQDCTDLPFGEFWTE
eukprot:6855651-Pyramimonas_sp.AAC.1